MHSIKTKLLLGISIFVIFLFSITAFLLIDEKERELARDIYVNARNFSELTSPKIVELAETLLAEKSFVIFNRDMKDIFKKNEDIAAVRLVTFGGQILYDSTAEADRAYEGPVRNLKDSMLAARVKSNLPSFLLNSGRTVFLKKTPEGAYQNVNENEETVLPISDTDAIANIVYPLAGKHAVIFELTYKNLQARVLHTTERIVLLLVFGILLGLGCAWYFATRITNPIAKLKSGAQALSTGDFTVRVRVKTRDEVGLLADTFNKMAQDLEVSTKALVYKERVAKELEVAANIQKQILPKTLPAIPGLDIAATVLPAAEIGGDCYDFIKLDEKNHLFYISDVTGHGIPAGIVVSIANAIIYSHSNSSDLRGILINANRVLKEKTAHNMFMTLLMCRYAEGKLNYVSAGHPEMLHYHAREKKVAIEKGGGIALGMVPDISTMLTEQSVSWGNGDCVVLYSDGIPEAGSAHGEQYGMQRFKRALSDHGELETAEAIKNALLADVKQFMGVSPQLDDITIVVIKRK